MIIEYGLSDSIPGTLRTANIENSSSFYDEPSLDAAGPVDVLSALPEGS